MRKNKLLFVLVVMLGILFLNTCSFASEITPYADTEFDSATPSLLSSESVKFTASTYDTKASISVTACWLETYMNGSWIKVCNLTPPSHVATNTFYYSKQ